MSLQPTKKQGAFSAAELASHLQGQVQGDASVELSGFAPAETAQTGDLTFAENERYFERAEQSAASAILVSGDFHSKQKVLIRVPNARIAFAKVLPLFFPQRKPAPGIHPSAVIAPSAQVHPEAHVGPLSVVEDGAEIGAGSVLWSGDYVGANCRLGDEVQLFPNVTLYPGTKLGHRVTVHGGTVVGSDGFGYVFDQGRQLKVPQIGDVIIGDDVEIGANVTIDRGALGSTVVGKGTKIDNLVQIAHNVVIGEHCIVVAQVGIAGSTKLGNCVVIGGQAGLAGHIILGDGASVAGQSGVMHNIPPGEKWLGSPAQPDRQTKRQILAIHRLPDLLQRVNRLEKRLEEFENRAPPK